MLYKALAKLLADVDFDRNVLWEETRETCKFTNEFWEIAIKNVADQTDDPRSLADFPLVKLRDPFKHDTNEPILQYHQQSAWDALEGLQHHVLSDVYWKQRTKEWLHQCLELLELLYIRCKVLANMEDAPLTVLNVKEYRTEYVIDPASDVKAATVTRGFIMDVAFSTVQILETSFQEKEYWEEKHRIIEDVDTVAICKHIRKECSKTDEAIIVRQRREYYEKLIMMPCDSVIFHRKNRFAYRTKPREILVNKNDFIYDDTEHCTTKPEVLVPRRHMNERETIMERISMDAMFTAMIKPFKWPALPIKYIRTMGLWRLEMTDVVYFESLLEAFVYYRRIRVQNGDTKHTGLDAYLTLTQTNQVNLPFSKPTRTTTTTTTPSTKVYPLLDTVSKPEIRTIPREPLIHKRSNDVSVFESSKRQRKDYIPFRVQ